MTKSSQTPRDRDDGLLACQRCETGVCEPCPPSTLLICATCGATHDAATGAWTPSDQREESQ
jgi:hypothetical protein